MIKSFDAFSASEVAKETMENSNFKVSVITSTINENDAPRKFGCLMLQFDEEGWKDEVESMIDENDLYEEEEGHGLELEPHCTVLYGFHDDEFSLDKCMDMLVPSEDVKVSTKKISLFENEKYDVLKYDIESEDLNRLNSEFSDSFKNTNDYPEYHAHCTIAYLKPGMGKKYVKDVEKEFSPASFKYSYGSGDNVYMHKKQAK